MSSNPYVAIGHSLHRTLREVIASEPLRFAERILHARVQLQAMFDTRPPVILKVRKDSASNVGSVSLGIDVWRPDDKVNHGLTITEGSALKMLDWRGKATPLVKDFCFMTATEAAHAAHLTESQWLGSDLQSPVWYGLPIVTLLDLTNVAGPLTDALDDALMILRQKFRHDTSKRPANEAGRQRAGIAFNDALRHFPDRFAGAIKSLVDELTLICWYLMEAVQAFDRFDRQAPEGSAKPLWEEATRACIDALVPGLRAMAYHGFGWPHARYRQDLVRRIHSAKHISKSEIRRFGSSLNAARRDELVAYLVKAEIFTVEGHMVALTPPEEFLQAQNLALQAASSSRSGGLVA